MPRESGAPKFGYLALLRRRLAANAGATKGERTQARLQIAATELLESDGFRALRVRDVCARAATAQGTFYLYFKDKAHLTTVVLTDFLEELGRWSLEQGRSQSGAFETVVTATRAWLAAARENAGLLRCVLQLSDETAAFARIFADSSHAWYLRVANSAVRRGKRPRDRDVALLAAYLLGGMVDDITRKLFVQTDEHLGAVAARVAASDDAIAEVIGLLWYRALYASEPDHLDHSASRRLHALALALQQSVRAENDASGRFQAIRAGR